MHSIISLWNEWLITLCQSVYSIFLLQKYRSLCYVNVTSCTFLFFSIMVYALTLYFLFFFRAECKILWLTFSLVHSVTYSRHLTLSSLIRFWNVPGYEYKPKLKKKNKNKNKNKNKKNIIIVNKGGKMTVYNY